MLLYTDDGGIQGNFYSLTIVDGKLQLDFRLGDSNQDILIERPVHSIRLEQPRVDDGKWHKFILFQAWENVKVQLDDTVVFKILTQRSFVFGNLRTNSDVFLGGLPNVSTSSLNIAFHVWIFQDVHQLGQMASPLRRHTKRFAGSVKNLVYRLYPQGVSSPQMVSSRGTRLTDDDYCSHESPCKNGARCFSTNDGASCDCSFTEFEGDVCEKKKTSPALSFFGHEWIGYDVTNFTSALVQNRFENISIQFRTAFPNGLLFSAGDKSVSLSHISQFINFSYPVTRATNPRKRNPDRFFETLRYREKDNQDVQQKESSSSIRRWSMARSHSLQRRPNGWLNFIYYINAIVLLVRI